MNTSIGTTTVCEIMTTVVITLQGNETMEAAAKLLHSNDIHAAPVVDATGRCVGILTSHDLMAYQAMRREAERLAGVRTIQSNPELDLRWPGKQFDEVCFHMTRRLETAVPTETVNRVARNMCRLHIHHVVVLNTNHKPIGILSSLDILGHILGEPVGRKTECID